MEIYFYKVKNSIISAIIAEQSTLSTQLDKLETKGTDD